MSTRSGQGNGAGSPPGSVRTEEKKPPVVSQSHSRRAGECSVFSVATRAREGKGKERVFFGGEGAGPGQQQAKLKYEWIAPKLQALDGGPDWRQRVLPGAPRLASTSNPMPGAAWAPCSGRGQSATETWKAPQQFPPPAHTSPQHPGPLLALSRPTRWPLSGSVSRPVDHRRSSMIFGISGRSGVSKPSSTRT